MHVNEDSKPLCAILSLDTEKAFGMLVWQYLWVVLRIFQVCAWFLKQVKVLYTSPSATVNTNELNYNPFSIFSGTRQNCRLFIYRCILSLELLYQHLGQNSVTFQIRTSHSTLALWTTLSYTQRT